MRRKAVKKIESEIYLSRDNHLRSMQVGQGWIMRTGGVGRTPKNFRAECIRAAREIGKIYRGRKIRIFLSGGIDSEVVAEAFYLAGIKFVPTILEYENGLNQIDIKWAELWCKKRGYKLSRVPFNIKLFLRSPWSLNTAKRLKYTLPVYLIVLRAMEKMPKGEVVVLGACEPLLIHRRKGDYLREEAEEISLFRYVETLGRPLITNFFHWSPELYFSYITSPEFFEFVRQKGEVMHSSFYLKAKLYRRVFRVKERPKRHGIEEALGKYSKEFLPIRRACKEKRNYVKLSKEIERLIRGAQLL